MRSIKKVTPLFLILIFLFSMGFGCGKKDEAFYLKNPDKAKEKLAACEKIMNKLSEAGNIKKLEKIVNDPECNAASNAVRKLNDEERERKRKQYEKEKAAKRAEEKALLAEHYKAYRKIPLSERVSEESPTVSQWLKDCNAISGQYLDCQTKQIGKLIYEESYKKYSTDSIAKEEMLKKCLNYQAEHNEKNKKLNCKREFNPRPFSFGFKSEKVKGVNECHAVHDVLADELVEKYKAMPLKKRVEEKIKCNELENDDLCSESLRKANKDLEKIFKEKFRSNSGAKSAQHDECEKMQKELNQKGRDFMFIMRHMGECKAANFW